MVPNTEQNYGGAWYNIQQPTASFSTTFTFQYSNIGGVLDDNGNAGTDGIALWLQTEGTSFTVNSLAAHPFLGVWFDGYKNNADGDVSSSQVMIKKTGAGAFTSMEGVEPNFVFRSGSAFVGTVSYDGATLSVYLNSALVASTPVNLTDMPSAYVGFIAYDGEAVANQYIDSWSFVSVPEPSSLIVFALLWGRISPRRLGLLNR